VSRDPGLQPERTRLAWRRTSLSIAVVALLTARLAIGAGTLGALVAAMAGLGWIAVTAICFRHATDRYVRAAAPSAGGPALPMLALATVGYAGLGAILILDSLG
jgi:uncharacterized membrane protein YidH (DUF202 family)